MLTESGDEDETNGIIDKVLDEIGIEVSGKVIQILAAPNEQYWNNFMCLLFISRCPKLLQLEARSWVTQ